MRRTAGTWAGATALAATLAVVTSCTAGQFPLARASRPLPPAETVAVARVLNEIKCDYLDFAYSDFARARRLPVGKVSGHVTLALSRDGTAPLGVAVAPGPLRLADDRLGPASAPESLTVPFVLDPQLALDPEAAGLDCAPAARLARPVLALTGLASAIAPAQGGGPYLQIRSPLHYQGAFYLLRSGEAVDAVPVRGDAARLGPDAAYLHRFDIIVETGGASWFSDVGPATAEPRPATAVPARPKRARPPIARPGLTRPTPAPAPTRSAVRPSVRVPTAPVAGRPRVAERVARPTRLAQRERRCVGGVSDMVCY